jgi:hypothetical protein
MFLKTADGSFINLAHVSQIHPLPGSPSRPYAPIEVDVTPERYDGLGGGLHLANRVRVHQEDLDAAMAGPVVPAAAGYYMLRWRTGDAGRIAIVGWRARADGNAEPVTPEHPYGAPEDYAVEHPDGSVYEVLDGETYANINLWTSKRLAYEEANRAFDEDNKAAAA